MAPLIDFDSVAEIISHLRIFGGATDAQRDTIFRRLKLWTLRAGGAVFHKGDEPLHIYIVKSGEIDLQITENEMIIHKLQLRVGECFGESSLMSMNKHTATAVATVDSEIIVLSRRALIALKREDLELFALCLLATSQTSSSSV